MQANKSEIVELVIGPLKAGYRPLKSPDREPVQYGEYVDLIVETIYERGFSPSTLKAGMKRFQQTWAAQRWPAAGELTERFDALQSDEQSFAPRITKPPGEKWADKLMELPEGQRALREGFAREVYLWAEKNPGMIPDPGVMEHLKSEETAWRAKLPGLIRRAKEHHAAKGDGHLGTLTLVATLRAAGQMQGFENDLRSRFLKAPA